MRKIRSKAMLEFMHMYMNAGTCQLHKKAQTGRACRSKRNESIVSYRISQHKVFRNQVRTCHANSACSQSLYRRYMYLPACQKKRMLSSLVPMVCCPTTDFVVRKGVRGGGHTIPNKLEHPRKNDPRKIHQFHFYYNGP